MPRFAHFYHHHAAYFWAGTAAALLVLLLWLIAVSWKHRRLRRRLDSLLADTEGGNLVGVLAEYLRLVRQVAGQSEEIKATVDDIARMLPSALAHVGLVRYSPFYDTGGDQSFSLALLDGKGDGVVISALHARRDSKIYAKPVRAGVSDYPLTDEEKRAVREPVAISGHDAALDDGPGPKVAATSPR